MYDSSAVCAYLFCMCLAIHAILWIQASELDMDLNVIDVSKFVKREMGGDGLFERFMEDVVAKLAPVFEG